MDLVKWIRKNQTKLMTYLLIFIMISFVGGYALQNLLTRMNLAGQGKLATFAGGREITRDVMNQAEMELKLLEAMRMDMLLRFKPNPQGQTDLLSALLGQIIFPDSQTAASLSDEMKRAIYQGRLSLSEQEIDRFFNKLGGPRTIYWILLKNEAAQAGVFVSNEFSRQLLASAVPQLTQNQVTAAQLMNQLIDNFNVTEQQILSTVSKLWAVLTYADVITSNENLTSKEIKATVVRKRETFDCQYVKFEAETFSAQVAEPTETQLSVFFEEHKSYLPETLTKDNPYGFGYKQPSRVKLEYVYVKLDDARELIEPVSDENAEDFYRQNSANPQFARFFQYEEPINPDDPQSETVVKTKDYAVVAAQIKQLLTSQRTRSKAEMILSEIREITEKPYLSIDIETADSEQIASVAVDYMTAVEKVAPKYGIKVHVGKTGKLSRMDMIEDITLGKMLVEGQAGRTAPLFQAVFAVEELEETILSRFDLPRPRIWENISPVRGTVYVDEKNPMQVLAMVRVVEAKKEYVPETMDLTISTKGLTGDPNTWSLREQVAEDFKLTGALEIAQYRAEEFSKLVTEKGWEEAIKAYNDQYDSEQEKIRIENIRGQRRLALSDIQRFGSLRQFGSRMSENMQELRKLNEQLYGLIGPDTTAVHDVNKVLVFQPELSCYVVKSVSRDLVNEKEFYDSRPQLAFVLNASKADSMALIHFDPENITKRMKYEVKGEDDTTEDADESATAGDEGENA